ncbi:MAG TPA: restriction endonuclease subunit S [Clostridia bacterium]|jgi:type I restriction enzyme S subunit|nr:restriction endonuclease subunit S [Clostridia bacterium]
MELKPIGKYVSLSQGLAINKDSAHLVSNSSHGKFKLPLLRIADMLENKFKRYVSTDVNSTVVAKKDDIIYTRTGQIGLAFRGFEGVVHNNSFIITLIDEELDKDYLFTVLQSDFFRNQALSFAKNSVQPDLTHVMFKKIMIPVPPKNIQKKIAKTYLTLTKKMTNNNSINKELELTARTIYDYWFLQFEFPNEDGKPYRSSGGKMIWNEALKREIPEGWEVKKILDLVLIGNTDAYDGPEVKTIDLSVMPSGSIALSEFNSSSNFDTNLFKMEKGDILFGSIRPYLKKAGIAPFDGAVAGTVHNFKCINNDYYNFLVMTLCSENMFNYAVNNSKGTKMPVVGSDRILDYPIAFNSDIVKKFNVLNLKDIVCNNIIENHELASLRDFLLPLFVSGQVSFKEEN